VKKIAAKNAKDREEKGKTLGGIWTGKVFPY
jgi:hypothetical protein